MFNLIVDLFIYAFAFVGFISFLAAVTAFYWKF